MGLFVSVSAVIGAAPADVVRALAEHVKAKHGVFLPEPRSPDDDDTMVISSAHGNTSLFFPGNDLSWWETSQALSKILQAPVFAFHIHDSDLWMYELYQNGQRIDGFNPVPDYWMEVSDKERRAYRGNAQLVAACVPGLSAAEISNYFIVWDQEADAPGKAYPSDECSYGDEWQMLDFMRKLKLPYPLDPAGQPTGPTYEFIIPAPPKAAK